MTVLSSGNIIDLIIVCSVTITGFSGHMTVLSSGNLIHLLLLDKMAVLSICFTESYIGMACRHD